jgi:hypothetical protein
MAPEATRAPAAEPSLNDPVRIDPARASLRAFNRFELEPLADGTRSRAAIALDFEGHGIGKLLVPLVIRRQAREQLPKNMQKLKEQLERSSPS